MTTNVTNPPAQSFHLGMLWTDTRYRSITIQFIALCIVFAAGYYVVGNVIDNLAALGKEFGFNFMTQPASYDINQQLIEYDSRESHARAAVLGMLNTLLVAVTGCFLATVIGVLAGVGRLSKNWLVAKLMTVYIETIRNIPVLIQILLISAVINETLPQPRDFRGADAEASMFLDAFAFTGRGFYAPAPVWNEGSYLVVWALVAGVIAAIVYGRWAVKRQQETGQELPIFPVKAGLILGFPFIMFFIAGMPIGLEYPELKGFNFRGGIFARDSYVALTLALAIYTGAFIAENVRAGIQAVSKGQSEAAGALGLRQGKTMSLVILPQALRIIIPPMISQYLNLTKNSSLALLVGYMDVTGTLGGISLNQTGREFECLFLLMAFYLAVSLSISAIMNLYNQNAQLVERTSATGLGISLRSFVDGAVGKWDNLKKGDAKMQPGYGIRLEMNLIWLFYGFALVAMLNYIFIMHASEARPPYYDWPTSMQVGGLLLTLTSFGALITCLFKNARFVDLAGLDLVAFLFAFAVGFDLDGAAAALLGDMAPAGVTLLVGGLVARVAIVLYTLFGARPNLTFFHRVRRA
ncbi:amino acid ABC transporter permease [Rhodovulum sp. DZ06]|uniref:amino acid ABC transporter permease n=1 Tax=Rhodovulum sp. DZ06 TaxID=3425126 RepID=UPI003D32E4D3